MNRLSVPPIGWRRNGLAFFLGILATLTLAPFFLFPLIIPAYGGLLWLIQNASTRRRAFADGWWWGWGFYMSGLYWFCIALLTDAEKFAWLIPFALFGLTAVIALYSGALGWLMKWTNASGIAGVFIFSGLWLAVEYARGHLFSGFPWNLAGYGFAFSDAALQMARCSVPMGSPGLPCCWEVHLR
jgi:apolipoprotein N-acyltransferase